MGQGPSRMGKFVFWSKIIEKSPPLDLIITLLHLLLFEESGSDYFSSVIKGRCLCDGKFLSHLGSIFLPKRPCQWERGIFLQLGNM